MKKKYNHKLPIVGSALGFTDKQWEKTATQFSNHMNRKHKEEPDGGSLSEVCEVFEKFAVKNPENLRLTCYMLARRTGEQEKIND